MEMNVRILTVDTANQMAQITESMFCEHKSEVIAQYNKNIKMATMERFSLNFQKL